MTEKEQLDAFLSAHGLESYAELLRGEGFEDVETLKELSEQELADLGFKLGHRKKLLKALRELDGPERPPVSQLPPLPPGIERAIATYPYPIALPLQEYAEDPTGRGKRQAVVDAFIGLIKYQGILLLTEYLRSEHRDDELTRMISKKLARPLESSWLAFTERAAPFLLDKGHELFVPELWPCYEAAETRRKPKDQVQLPGSGYIDDDGRFVATKAKVGLFRALLNFRNKVAHKSKLPNEQALEEAAFFLGVLETLLDELSWLGDYTLYLRDDGVVWRMAGVRPERCELDWPSDAPASGLLLAAPQGDTSLPVFPLFLAPRAFVARVDDGLDMLVYAGDTGARLSYVSPKGYDHQINAVHRDWRRLLEQKQVLLEPLAVAALTPEEIGRRAERVTRDTEEALLASRKVLRGVYVARDEAELHLERYPASTFPLSLVTAQAGSGKTSLLHHLAGVWRQQGMSVVLVRANAIEGADLMTWLRQALRLGGDVDAAALAQQGASPDRPLVLVIDGLNEHAERGALLASILQLAEATRGEGYLRIQLSWRSEHADWAEAADAQGMLFYPAPSDAASATPEAGSSVGGDVSSARAEDARQMAGAVDDDRAPSLHLTPWRPEEVSQLWDRLAGSDKQRFEPRFSYEDLREKAPAAAQVLSNPLWLRIFLEVYAGQEMPASPSRRALQQAWYERLGERTGDDNRLLLDLARMCMEQQTQALDLDDLYDDERTKEAMRRTDVAAPLHLLEGREGVLALLKGARIDVVFTMDRFLEQAAGQALVLDGDADTPGDLLAAHARLQGWFLADEAVRNALELKLGEQPDFLWGLIDEGGTRASLLAGEALARRILETRAPQDVAVALMQDASEGDLHAAREAAERLESILAFDLQTEFVCAVVRAIPDEGLPTVAEMELRRVWVRALARAGSPELASQADAMKRRAEASSSDEVAMIGLEIRAFIEQGANNKDGAIELLHELASMQAEVFGSGSAAEADTQAKLGDLYQRMQQWEDATQCRERALAIERALNPCDRRKVALRTSQLGWLLQEKGEVQRALELRQEALSVRRQAYGELHPEVAESLSAIGGLYLAMGDHDCALEYRERARTMFEQAYGQEHPRVADEWMHLATAHGSRGDESERRRCLQHAYEILGCMSGNWTGLLDALAAELRRSLPAAPVSSQRRLTKSRFVRGVKCSRKLFYEARPDVYPEQPVSEFVQALAEGGHQVGELAKVLQGKGELVDDLREEPAVAKTKALMERDEVTIYEGAFCVPEENLLIRVDVLHKCGNRIRLLEVKSRGLDPGRKMRIFCKRGNGIRREWVPYVLDVAFQQYVLERCYPDAEVGTSLLALDMRATCGVAGLHQRFSIKRVVDWDTGRLRLKAVDRGYPEAWPIMLEVPLDPAVEFARTRWRDEAGRSFDECIQDLAQVCGDGRKPVAEVGAKCRRCEFRRPPALGPDQRNGFAECWSETFGVPPSEVLRGPLVLDLSNNQGIYHQLSEGKWRLHDLAADFPWSGAPPVDTSARQAIQVHVSAGLRPGPYYEAADLRRTFEYLKYPLHFIRCHSVAQAIPSAEGRRPYEQNAFQFSHHALYEDGRLEHHGEWLDDEVGVFPNYRFLRALRDSVGTGGGTLVHYAPGDNTLLNQIRRHLLIDPSPPDDRDGLVAFVEHWATPSRNEGGWSPSAHRLDLAEWVRGTFYCASMAGSYALKAVLAAMLQGSELLERRFGLPVYGVEGGMSSSNFVGMQWFCRDADGRVADPYSLVPKNPYLPSAANTSGHAGDKGDDRRVVADITALDGSAQQESAFMSLWNHEGQAQGSGGDEVALSRPAEDMASDPEEEGASLAWTLYSRLQFEAVEDEERAAIRQELLRTGELDTLALAMILLHLQSLAAQEA